MSAAAEIVRARGGDWHGSWGAFPGPGHSERDRSVTIRDRGDGGIVIHSFAGDDWRVIRDDLAAQGLIDAKRAKAADVSERERLARERDIERDRAWAAAADECAAIWNDAPLADASHPYLARKQMQPHGTRLRGRWLLVPMFAANGVLASLQAIARVDHESRKRFHPGGRVKGCYFDLGNPGPVLIVAEGFSTGATIREATGHHVRVAFSAANMVEIARFAWGAFPAARILIAADHDKPSRGFPDEGGAGRVFATRAASACAGRIVMPPGRGDWNDHGPAAAKEAFA